MIRFRAAMTFLAGFYAAAAVLEAFLGLNVGSMFLASAAVLAGAASVVLTICIRNERKTNGRYRKAAEAHRAGAGGSTSDSAGARGSAGGGAGPRVGGGTVQVTVSTQEISKVLGLFNRTLPSQGRLLSSASVNIPAPLPMKKAASEFHGASFAAGKVTGARSFSVDKLGRLTGVSYRAVWTPGENHAECRRANLSSGVIWYADANDIELDTTVHGMDSCGHGFYGYYDGSDDYHEEGYVSGVIEGYGETLIGTRGFRCMKARIVALHIPDEVPASLRKMIIRNYPEVAICPSFEFMVEAFPPDDAGQGLNPSTDPDFWEREA